jgi:hypothetical protein
LIVEIEEEKEGRMDDMIAKSQYILLPYTIPSTLDNTPT